MNRLRTDVARQDSRAEQAHPCGRVKAEVVSEDSQLENLLCSVLGVRSEAADKQMLLRRQMMFALRPYNAKNLKFSYGTPQPDYEVLRMKSTFMDM
ncbi:hypothetical protein J6590_075247 [Homalodisca vitripennis]|nr:hypothetical protein J6590_075247 [Homalodisca vitripennis]